MVKTKKNNYKNKIIIQQNNKTKKKDVKKNNKIDNTNLPKLKDVKMVLLSEYEKYFQARKFPLCKIKEFKALHNLSLINKYYCDIRTNKQIISIVKLFNEITTINVKNYNYDIQNQLLTMLCSNMNHKLYNKVLNKIEIAKTDDEVYKYVKELYNLSTYKNMKPEEKQLLLKTLKLMPCKTRIIFAQEMIYNLMKYLKVKKTFKYLDIGSGDSNKTYLIGTELGLNLKKQVYGIDLSNYVEIENFKPNKFNQAINYKIITYGEKYTFPDKYFNLTSAFMVLHHVENLDFTLKEINRITKKNGFFLIQEHDAMNIIDKMIIDIEHSMYPLVYSNEYNTDFRKDYYAYYFNKYELDIILARYGFECVEKDYFYYSINNKINNNRSYWAIYKKISDL